MMQYDVVMWQDYLSDGTVCYAAVCPSISYAHGQGDTAAEALADAADTMAVFLEKMPGKVKTGAAAQDELAQKLAELTDRRHPPLGMLGSATAQSGISIAMPGIANVRPMGL